MAKNLTLIQELSERKAQLEALILSSDAEIVAMEEKLENIKVLSGQMSNRVNSLDDIQEYDPTYTASELETIRGMMKEVNDKVISFKMLVREKRKENEDFRNEYLKVTAGYENENAIELQVEALQTELNKF